MVALTLPLSVYNVCNFICYLFGRAYSPSTIVSHTCISAISYIHKIMDIQDPTTSFLIGKLLKGCNNLQPNRDCRLPITKDILIKIVNSLNLCIPEHANRILLKAIFLLSFVVFLRLGEILIRSKAHSDKLLQVADVAISYEKGIPANLNITLRHFRNIKASQPAIFSITVNGKNPNLCPVQAIHEYIQLFKPIQGPLFQFLGNSPVTHSFVSSKLHMLLQSIGLNATKAIVFVLVLQQMLSIWGFLNNI